MSETPMVEKNHKTEVSRSDKFSMHHCEHIEVERGAGVGRISGILRENQIWLEG
jgi:hypothetical protein